MRRELINFKKLCLHHHAELARCETKLRQLSAFFWQPTATRAAAGVAAEAGAVEPTNAAARYDEISVALVQCRGARLGLQDARTFSRAAVCIHRHPARELPAVKSLSAHIHRT